MSSTLVSDDIPVKTKTYFTDLGFLLSEIAAIVN